ncbi:MAG: Gfo/Idh/MocA family oxidoreductase [Phycisphaeraceae bacterium]|nr:Gfo/Idh/MocA family oxidoreductase [Phycisphaeraceae bacterium]
MNSNRIRVGLVGCGNAGRGIHLPLLNRKQANYQVVVCADAMPESAKKLASDSGLRAAASVDALLGDPEVELVVCATKPPSTHRDIAVAALARGKHVVVEKPMAGTPAECDQMIDAAGKAKRVLSVHHNRRWDVDFLMTAEAVASGKLGDLRLVRNEYLGDFAGSRYDWGIHLADQTMCLSAGRKFVEVTATFATANPKSPMDSDGFFTARLRTEDGVLHDLSMFPGVMGSHVMPGKMPKRFVVVGTKGMVYQDWCQRIEDAFGKTRDFVSAEPKTWLNDPSSMICQFAVPDFYDALYDAIRHGKPNPVPGDQGRRAVLAWELICQSAVAGKTLRVDL